jgi:hypothetical protein
MLVATIIPVGDAAIVLHQGGSRATAFGIPWAGKGPARLAAFIQRLRKLASTEGRDVRLPSA